MFRYFMNKIHNKVSHLSEVGNTDIPVIDNPSFFTIIIIYKGTKK